MSMLTEVKAPEPLPDGAELRREVAMGHALSDHDLGELKTLSRELETLKRQRDEATLSDPDLGKQLENKT